MRKKRNRIAFQGKEGAWEWYWLMNRHKNHDPGFVLVTDSGDADSDSASDFYGVRPVFCLQLDSHELLEEE